jgi:hypothetical protein
MSTLALRQHLVDIASADVGAVETSRNRGPKINKFWSATTYPSGYVDRQPYCAAAMCYWVREWLRDPAVVAALSLTPAKAEMWRCKSARAFDWIDWAKKRELAVLSDSPTNRLRVGDIMVFDMSHIGIVTDDSGSKVYTIEANTGANGGRDGDGVFRKVRDRSLARAFIRLLPP